MPQQITDTVLLKLLKHWVLEFKYFPLEMRKIISTESPFLELVTKTYLMAKRRGNAGDPIECQFSVIDNWKTPQTLLFALILSLC